MKPTLKLLSALLMATCAVTLGACSNDHDGDDSQHVNPAQMPQTAKTFIATYYPTVTISYVDFEIDNGVPEYDVHMANGHEIKFTATGEWLDVDAPKGQSIPEGIAPEKISEYVFSTYPSTGINEISRTVYGYDVELINGLDLAFDLNGSLIGLER